MENRRTDIYVYAHWTGMYSPGLVGVLSASRAGGRKSFSFEYDRSWLYSKEQMILDPDIGWFGGLQYPIEKENFGIILDSMPDSWGRTLMKMRAAQKAREEGTPTPKLYDIDFLLGVYDKSRMGGLRFKLDPDGTFLDDNEEFPTPPWSSVRELQHAAYVVEESDYAAEIKKWL